MNKNNNSYGNINLSMGTLGGGGGVGGGGNLLGTGAGMGYVGAPLPGPTNN